MFLSGAYVLAAVAIFWLNLETAPSVYNNWASLSESHINELVLKIILRYIFISSVVYLVPMNPVVYLVPM